jgi:hypothetical protein
VKSLRIFLKFSLLALRECQLMKPWRAEGRDCNCVCVYRLCDSGLMLDAGEFHQALRHLGLLPQAAGHRGLDSQPGQHGKISPSSDRLSFIGFLKKF